MYMKTRQGAVTLHNIILTKKIQTQYNYDDDTMFGLLRSICKQYIYIQ